jgi:diguanylate cyclase (GGDEF)-like protein
MSNTNKPLVNSGELNLFQSAIHITEERDKRSLEKALLETVTDFIDFEALILLRLPRSSGIEYLELAESVPPNIYAKYLKEVPFDYGDRRIEADKSLLECVNSAKIISVNAKPERVVFPVIVNNVIVGLIDIYGYQRSEASDKLITGFIRIYSNFLSIINDNEHDTLTGLLNRKTFDRQLSNLMEKSCEPPQEERGIERRHSKTKLSYWVGILDIDHFKNINDTFGHIYGDEVLLLFSDLMKKSFRNDDLLFRYGGEEFVVVLSPTTFEHAMAVFERFRIQLEEFHFPQVGKVTVSSGITCIESEQHASTLLERADRALYYAKEHGRNQVQIYQHLIDAGLITEKTFGDDIELF